MEEDLALSTINQEKETLKLNDSRLSGFIKDVIDEINLVRTNPQDYVKKLKELRKYVFSKENIFQNKKDIIVIPDLEKRYDELVSYISQLTPLEALVVNEYLINSTDELINILQKNEKKDENIITNSILDASIRLKKHGIINGIVGEIIDIGSSENAEFVVLKLLIDEKDDKSERNLIFNSRIKYIGGSYYESSFQDNIILALNFSEFHSMKIEKSIINLNVKISIERLGKSLDSSKCFILKKKKFEEDNKIIESKKLNSNLNKSMMKINSIQQSQNPNKGTLFSKENGSSKQKNIVIPQKMKYSYDNESFKEEEDSIKSLKISNDNLLKASSLMKKMPSRINYNNTKIVNINVNIENEAKELKKQTSTLSTDKKGKNIPISTISNTPSQDYKTKVNANFDDILLSDDSRGEEIERKNNFKAQIINQNCYLNKHPNQKINKKSSNNRSTIAEENRKQNSGLKNHTQRASSGKVNREKPKMIDYSDKKTFDKEILSDKNIKCMKINKTIEVDDEGKEFYIIKKTIFFNNNSTEEWIFKEEI
jgi:hypothetical protein